MSSKLLLWIPLVVTGAAPSPAHAESSASDLGLVWSAPDECPSRAEVVAETRRLLGGRIDENALAARAEITRTGPSDYHLTLRLLLDPGEPPRKLQAPSCADLGDAAALLLALAIDSAAVASKPARHGSLGHPGAPPPPPAPAELPGIVLSGALSGSGGATAPMPSILATPASILPALALPTPVFAPPVFSISGAAVQAAEPRTRVAPRPWMLRVHLTLGADAGTFSAPASAVRVGASLVSAPLRLEIAAWFAEGGAVVAPLSSDKGGYFRLRAGTALACHETGVAHFRPGPVGVAVCAGLEGGALAGASFGVTRPSRGEGPWGGLAGALIVRWPLWASVAARFDLSLGVPIVRPTFYVQGLGSVHEPGFVVGRAWAGVEVDIGNLGRRETGL